MITSGARPGPASAGGVCAYRAVHHNSPGSFFSSHQGGAQFLNMDGSCRFLSSSVSIDNYRSLCSRNGGEVISGDAN